MMPAVFTIAPERPFLEALAAGLIARYFDTNAPERLGDITVLLPTRRAARALGEALLGRAEAMGVARALVLPAIRPLGDVDEEGLVLSESEFGAEGALEVPPVLPGLRRRLLLGRLVSAFYAHHHERRSEAEIGRLAMALERLLDQVATHDVDLARLDDLVPAAFAQHWAATLDFLHILTTYWPQILSAEGAIETAKRRDLLMEIYRRALETHSGSAPVIAAGSTGTHPTTARLLATLARLPGGAVVLPGLDQALAADAWEHVGPSHPQGAMRALLKTLGVTREEVALWDHGEGGGSILRTRVLQEALRPWQATDGWRVLAPELAKEIRAEPLHVTRLDAPHPGAEADAVALVLRNALESPSTTAALVTPDRRLARGVVSALRRWDVDIDDSAGEPLALAPPLVFLRLVARAVEQGLAPAALLAALKHPFCGLTPHSVRAFERAVLRGLAPGPGLTGLQARIAALRESPARDAATRFVGMLAERLGAFCAALAAPAPQELAPLLALHIAAAEALAATPSHTGADRLWQGAAGEAASTRLSEILAEAAYLPTLTGADYAAYLDLLLEGPVLRPAYGRHPRLSIWGPLEARLQRADVVVLGGLNEGTWPREPAPDPWLSRAMMETLGLPPPEQRLGLAAHDFVAIAAQARHVVLTRAEKVDGAPTVPSRWLVRLDAFLGGLDAKDELAATEPWLGWARALDAPDGPVRPEPPPAPAPPVALRPRALSVTGIATWLRDPYAIYAKHILGLKPLDPIDEVPGPSLRGTVLHEIFQRFVQAKIDPRAASARATMIALGEEVFARRDVPQAVRAFWWPRFIAAADWLLAGEAARYDAGHRSLAAEIKGTLALEGPAGPFTLNAKADRIDRLPSGALEIVDYKTGKAPTEAQMNAGLEPQLPLEAAIARAGGFEDIAAGSVESLRVLVVKGTRTGNDDRRIGDADRLGAEHLARLKALIAQFDEPARPYRAAVMPLFRAGTWAGDYDHLARVAEWTANSEENGP